MTDNNSNQPKILNNLFDFKLHKKKKDTAEIARSVAQQICQDCIEEYNKIKSNIPSK